ncbi:MAG TPA: Spy/CpxP family protein refolding chaperone [Burkholderiaceae bacterium]|nr:Spy/CpxP family protein refolding chaperone [Burkholderiaceae bacterium]
MKRADSLPGIAALVFGVALFAAAPAGHALQPEPQLMLEADSTAAAVPLAALAGDPGGPDRDGPDGMEGWHRGGHRGSLLPPYIRLTEQQQDKLFDLRHAQAPALRAQFKELQKARAQLRALALADNYDEAQAKQIAARAAQARSEIDMMHVRLQHAAFAMLTPEQRKRIDECKPGADGMRPRDCMPRR